MTLFNLERAVEKLCHYCNDMDLLHGKFPPNDDDLVCFGREPTLDRYTQDSVQLINLIWYTGIMSGFDAFECLPQLLSLFGFLSFLVWGKNVYPFSNP